MLNLYHYQEKGAQFLARLWKAFLADEMGLGKTVQAIRAMDMAGILRGSVLCPASVRPVWEEEMKLWSLISPEMTIHSYDEVVVNPSRLLELADHKPEVLILDEAHYLKSPDAKRTKLCYDKLPRLGSRIWSLSGTPAPNNASELWTHARALGGETLGHEAFAARYCHLGPSDYGPFRVFGNKREMVPELANKLQPWMLRRLAADELDLPPMNWGHLYLEGAPNDVRNLNEFEPKAQEKIRAILMAAKHDPEAVEFLERNVPYTATLRRLTGMAKVRPVVEEVTRVLNEGLHKIVLFAWHKDVIEALRVSLQSFGVATIHGGTSRKGRKDEYDAFQHGNARVFIGQITAAGVGITLTITNHAIFVEPDWNPSNMAQAAKRLHRIGQELPVFIRVALLRGTLDDPITRVCTRRAQDLYELLDRRPQ